VLIGLASQASAAVCRVRSRPSACAFLIASPRFAIVTLAGGWAMGVGYLIVAALALYQMWFSHEGS